ncbi:hypothetical protein KEM54_000882 [Ascosphaera aggregata]|nr:hypothetical protein KEM54_000882 [Ascosphaera aggregata]
MVLHLLGKKSWNVYNQDNIARVQRDEAEAAEREKEKSRLEQRCEAERRIALLRGQRPLSPGLADGGDGGRGGDRGDGDDGEIRERLSKRSRRRIAGEDDTDKDIRIARERSDLEKRKTFTIRSSDVSLLDAEGHTNLFPVQEGKVVADGRVSTQEDRKRREEKSSPWYTSTAGDVHSGDIATSKDVWGNQDPRRQERQQQRLHVDDPLQAMKKGVTQLREMVRARREIEEERRGDLELLRYADDEYSRRSRRRRRSASPVTYDSRDTHSSRHHSRSGRNGHRHRHHHLHRQHHEDGISSHHITGSRRHRSRRHRPEG